GWSRSEEGTLLGGEPGGVSVVSITSTPRSQRAGRSSSGVLQLQPGRTVARKSVEPLKVQVGDPAKLPGELKRIGGSPSDEWNNILASISRCLGHVRFASDRRHESGNIGRQRRANNRHRVYRFLSRVAWRLYVRSR